MCCQLSLFRDDRRTCAVQGWNALLTEVLHMVLNGSSEEFCWQLRGMASSWAVAIRSFTKAQLVISAEQNTGHWAGVGQLFQFAQQRSHQYPSASFIIQPHQPLVPTACMKFLQGLADQARMSTQGHLHQVLGLLKQLMTSWLAHRVMREQIASWQ